MTYRFRCIPAAHPTRSVHRFRITAKQPPAHTLRSKHHPQSPDVYAFFTSLAAISSPFLRASEHTSPIVLMQEKVMETVNTLHVVYGLGATCAALLLVYLVVALVRAEDF
jgi:K+-transporting ATPase KdpF subunit